MSAGHAGEDISDINRSAWTGAQTLRWFARYEGWSDPGEEAAFARLGEEMRGKRILDIGVGAGRTVPLLLALSEDYEAIDFVEPMLELCRAKHPQVRASWGDARDLGRFAASSFDLVVFSWNGIDAVGHEDRQRILDEVHRVLVPGGMFLFSSHNQCGPGYGEKPWTIRPRDLRHPGHIVDLATHLRVNVRNHRRHRADEQTGDGWSIRNAAAHNFDLVIHYIRPEHERDELARHGFLVTAVLESEHGAPVAPGTDPTAAWWCHYLARKAD